MISCTDSKQCEMLTPPLQHFYCLTDLFKLFVCALKDKKNTQTDDIFECTKRFLRIPISRKIKTRCVSTDNLHTLFFYKRTLNVGGEI